MTDLTDQIFLLPSQIEKNVLIRRRDNPYGNDHYYKARKIWHYSIVCVLTPQKHKLVLFNYYNPQFKNDDVLIRTPRIMFQFDIEQEQKILGDGTFSDLRFKDSYYYLFQKEEASLVESIKCPRHYFLPHIYYSGHICLNSSGKLYSRSPKRINLEFWSNKFHYDWFTQYEQTQGRLNDKKWVETHKIDDSSYQAYQDNSSSPILDEEHKKFLDLYTNLFESPEKPDGIFFRLHTDKEPEIGFAFFVDNQYQVVLPATETLLTIDPKQATIY